MSLKFPAIFLGGLCLALSVKMVTGNDTAACLSALSAVCFTYVIVEEEPEK